MKTFVYFTMAAAVVAGATSASAESGPYAAFHLGISNLGDQSIDDIDTDFGPQPGGYIDSNTGEAFGFALGWNWDNGFRTEVELNRRRNEFTRATAGALSDANTNGHGVYDSVFVNVYYDFPQPQDCTSCLLKPYIGAGVGKTWTKWDDVVTFNDGESVGHDSSDSATSAQVMLGAAYDLPQVDGLMFTAELRYTKLLSDLSYDGDVLESPIGAFPITTNVSDTERTEILIGLRYNF